MLRREHATVPNVSYIDLKAGGSCDLHEFVDGVVPVSGVGMWEITEEREMRSDRRVSVLHIVEPGRRGYASMYFTKRREKLILWQYRGDPDDRNYVEYERI